MNKKGFTLIELLVVISIIGILVIVAVQHCLEI
nr:prepilin-type N-terminal cleavage/methylation domain-containing protein [Clostridioides difficile]